MAGFRYLYRFIRENSFLKIARQYLMRSLYRQDGNVLITTDLYSNQFEGYF